jgi:SAM-dependent methyltransferase
LRSGVRYGRLPGESAWRALGASRPAHCEPGLTAEADTLAETENADQRRLYRDLAWTWPIISAREEYVQESEEFARLIREHSRIHARTLLNMGCGGGHNDYTLKKHFALTSFDLSLEMLRLARRLNPDVTYVCADMRSARLRTLFDAVVVFDSLAHMQTAAELRSAFATAYAHLRPGGVFVTYPEATPESFVQNRTDAWSRTSGDVEVTFVENYYDPDPADTTYESTFVYLIRKEGRLTIETDRHICGLFPLDAWVEQLRSAGFEVTQLRSGPLDSGGTTLPTFVCRK